MRVKVERIGGHLVPVCPGASRMHVAFDHVTALLTLTCLFCGERTLRFLVVCDEFEVRHRKRCRLREIRSVGVGLEAHPVLVGLGRGDDRVAMGPVMRTTRRCPCC